MEFIVGGWYKNPGNFAGSEITWAKFEKWEDNSFYFTEWINKGTYENKKSYWYYSECDGIYEPVNIKKIKKYLPFNHPDCVTITNENMKYLISILKKHGIQ